jgi:HIRAN domain
MTGLLNRISCLFGSGTPGQSPKGYVGTIGQRDVFTLTLVARRQVPLTGSTVYEFRDPSDASVAWFSPDLALELGQTYPIRATVHRQLRYQGVPTTYLTRGTVLLGWAGPAAAASAPSVTVRYTVVGTAQTNPDGRARQQLIRRCRVGEVVTLHREPSAPGGGIAVAVVTRHGQIGEIASGDSAAVARRLDRGAQARCIIAGIVRGSRGARSRNVELEVRWPPAESASSSPSRP